VPTLPESAGSAKAAPAAAPAAVAPAAPRRAAAMAGRIVFMARSRSGRIEPTNLSTWLTMTTEVAIYEAKTRLSELLAAVEQGEQVTITRRGRPVARLVAIGPVRREASQRQRVTAVFARMRQQRQGVTLEGDLREWIEAGRD
jgi:prevent-host-death family protein